MGSERSKIIFPVVLPVFTLSILVIKKGFGTLEAILLTSWFGHLPIFAAEVGNLPKMPVCCIGHILQIGWFRELTGY